MILQNCGITLDNSEVLKPCVMSKSDPEFLQLKQFHTGLDLSAINVFAVYPCRVSYIGSEPSGKIVIVQTGDLFCIAYKRLVEVTVSENDLLLPTYMVGIVDKYVHIEVYTKDPSNFPVRVGTATWYKQDANLAVTGGLDSYNMYAYKQDYLQGLSDEVTELTDSILSNNGGR